MKKILIATVLLFAVVAKLYSQNPSDYHFYYKENIELLLPNGNTVCVFVAYSRKDTTEKLPCVLMYNIYAKPYSNEEIEMQKKRLPQKGYAFVEANIRGKNCSNSPLAPFEYDAEDAYYIIDWISKQAWCNGKVAMKGGSYLGFSQWASTKKMHPALKTIVPMVSVSPGFDFPMQNGIFMTYMLSWIHFVTDNKFINDTLFLNQAKWEKIFTDWFKSGAKFSKLDSFYDGKPNATFQRWLQHDTYDDFWKKMTPQKKAFAKINIPVLTITGNWDDDQTGAIYYYKQHHRHNKKANHYLIFGPYDHFGAQNIMRDTLLGLPIDSVGIIKFNTFVDKWYNHIFKDSSKPALLANKVNYEISGKNEWKHAPSLDKMYNTTTTFYLNNGNLSNSKSSPKSVSSFTLNYADRSIIRDIYGDIGLFPKVLLDSLKLYPWQLKFETNTIDDSFAIAGNFEASLDIIINKKDVDLAIELYEQLPNGKYIGLSSITQRASLAKNLCKRILLKPNKLQTIKISNSYISCKQINKGSKIVAVIGINYNPMWQVNYGTGKNVNEEDINDAGEPILFQLQNTSCIKLKLLK